MSDQIKAECIRRGISRVCHFTPSRNLAHIAVDQVGVLATRSLRVAERRIFNPTDLARYDGHEGHICCSIEYPNGWYFDRARIHDRLFKDWVVLFISADVIWRPGTLFCPRNAAAGRGTDIRAGGVQFNRMFAPRVEGQRTFNRGPTHLLCSPTDDQAEVLVPDKIELADVIGVAVQSEEQAKREFARLDQLGIKAGAFRFVVAPTLFDKNALSAAIRAGKRPLEQQWKIEKK